MPSWSGIPVTLCPWNKCHLGRLCFLLWICGSTAVNEDRKSKSSCCSTLQNKTRHWVWSRPDVSKSCRACSIVEFGLFFLFRNGLCCLLGCPVLHSEPKEAKTICGIWKWNPGPFQWAFWCWLQQGGNFTLSIPDVRNIFWFCDSLWKMLDAIFLSSASLLGHKGPAWIILIGKYIFPVSVAEIALCMKCQAK